MRKSGRIKGNLRPNDYMRALITDTSPFEVPVIFSNDGFYKNCTRVNRFRTHLQEFAARLLKAHRYSIPYRYNIVKSSSSFRQLSLLHPSSQIASCELYQMYEHLICYYTSLSPFSMRAPQKVGSSFYFSAKISGKNKYKNGTVDTVDIEKFVRNPASYFSYRGYNRLYKFFISDDFIRLEKKYRLMLSLDVSKCFDSLYTHSLAWALKDIDLAKENIGTNQFGENFDSLMQKMNYNETNGICIGPEISRIFSEIIFQKIDLNVKASLSCMRLEHERDYEIRRYIDNFYIFANDEAVCKNIQLSIARMLREYKMNLNENKIELQSRPFYTKKSRIIDSANKTLAAFFEQLLGVQRDDKTSFFFPRRVFRYQALFQSVIKQIKANCFDSAVGYDTITAYVIPSFGNRLIALVEDYKHSRSLSICEEDDFVTAILMLLELSFFFYTLNPTVASSLSVAKSIIISARFMKSNFPARLPFLQERVAAWTVQLMNDPHLRQIMKDCDAVPIEILNILIAMHDIAADHTFDDETFRKIFLGVDKAEYFSLVSCLFILRDNPSFVGLRGDIFARISQIVLTAKDASIDSQAAHLLLDTLSCPFIPLKDRVLLYKESSKALKLSNLTNAQAEDAVKECEQMAWFVNWTGVELLNMISKKELSPVY